MNLQGSLCAFNAGEMVISKIYAGERKIKQTRVKKRKEDQEKERGRVERDTLTTVLGFPQLFLRVYLDCLVVCSLKHVPELKTLT